MSKYKVVLFDLDGTLINTSLGIFNSVRFAEKKLGLKTITDSQLRNFIGPPPIQSYMDNHGVSKDIAIEATKFHRQYGAEKGVYEAQVYDGITDLLQELKRKDILLGVCTLKRQDIAEKVLIHFDLYKYFDVIVGIDQQESLSKADTVNIALNSLKVNCKDAVLIGDSVYDAEGAAEAGVDFIGVLYGFGLNENNSSEYETKYSVDALINSMTKDI